MATYSVSRNDLQALAERLSNRARTPLLDDVPETRKDLKLAAGLLAYVAALGLPISVVSLNKREWA